MSKIDRDAELCNFISRNNINSKDSFYEDKIASRYTLDEENTTTFDNLITNLNEKWIQIDKTKKKIIKPTPSIKELFKENRKNTNNSVSNAKKILQKHPKSKKTVSEEINEFENFIKQKIKQLEKYKTGFHFENKKVEFLVTKKDKDSFLSDKIEKSFIKKDNIDNNIEEILNPSKKLLTKMNNIYEMISTHHEKTEEENSMIVLEQDFGKLITKINPSVKNKSLYEKQIKQERNHSTQNKNSNKICEKNNFDVNYPSNVRLKKLLNK
jgi:hypothetical protein